MPVMARAFPDFRIEYSCLGFHYWCYEAVRKNLDPGLYAMITSNPDELWDALAADAALAEGT